MCSILILRLSQASCEAQNLCQISRKTLASASKLIVALASPLQVCRSSWGRMQALCKFASLFRDVCKPLAFPADAFWQVCKPLARSPISSEAFARPLQVRPHSLAHHPTLISKNPMAKLRKNPVGYTQPVGIYAYLIENCHLNLTCRFNLKYKLPSTPR